MLIVASLFVAICGAVENNDTAMILNSMMNLISSDLQRDIEIWGSTDSNEICLLNFLDILNNTVIRAEDRTVWMPLFPFERDAQKDDAAIPDDKYVIYTDVLPFDTISTIDIPFANDYPLKIHRVRNKKMLPHQVAKLHFTNLYDETIMIDYIRTSPGVRYRDIVDRIRMSGWKTLNFERTDSFKIPFDILVRLSAVSDPELRIYVQVTGSEDADRYELRFMMKVKSDGTYIPFGLKNNDTRDFFIIG